MTSTPIGDPLLDEDGTFGSRIIEILEAFTPPGDFQASEVTGRAWEWLTIHDPDLLDAWSKEITRQTMNSYFRQHLRSKRGRWARATRSRTFRAAADEATETGDLTALNPFSLAYVVNEESLRRRVSDMTAGDHLFVAEQHEKSSDRILLLAAFHRAIAKRIPLGKTTADVMDEETYSRVYASIVK